MVSVELDFSDASRNTADVQHIFQRGYESCCSEQQKQHNTSIPMSLSNPPHPTFYFIYLIKAQITNINQHLSAITFLKDTFHSSISFLKILFTLV